MAVSAIICEYNPFHNGHKYQIDSIKPDTVVCLMSSNYVQRGSLAVCDKYYRAKAALMCGADLVLELPFPFSMSSAEKFSSSGISILDKLGVIDKLSFGCESGEFSKLNCVAEYIASDEFDMEIKELLNEYPKLPFAVIREKAVEAKMGKEISSLLREPNNILGIEYIKAIRKSNSLISPCPILRHIVNHNDIIPKSGFASATNIREFIKNGEDFFDFIPDETKKIYLDASENGDFPSDERKLESAVLYFLRKTSSEELSEYYDCNGINVIIKKAVQKATSIDELYQMCRNRNYTSARIRRCILSAFLGVKKDVSVSEPLYTTVLGFNERGAGLLSKAKKISQIPIITKPAHIKKYKGTDVYTQFMAGVVADDIYSLTLPQTPSSHESMKKGPVCLV